MELYTKSNKIIAGEEAIIEIRAISHIEAWEATLTEEPNVGGSITPKKGKRILQGEFEKIVYKSVAPTSARIVVFGACSILTGRGVIIEVKKESKGIFNKISRFFD
jgi:hypothetical protein